MKLSGIFASLATPFDHLGDLYRVKVQHNVEKWNRTSLTGYLVGGSAGEGALLSIEEAATLFDWVAEWKAPERILIADATREGVRETVRLANRAAEFRFSAVLASVPSHYRKTLSPGLAVESEMLYFRSVADQSKVPVIVNANGKLSVNAVAALSQHPNIAGVLLPGLEGGFVQAEIAEIKKSARAGLQILTGSSDQLWASLQGGAHGAILNFASAAPYACIAIWEAFRTRETEAGEYWQQRIVQPGKLLNAAYGIAGLKHAMDLNGYYGGPPRLPLSVCSTEARDQIAEAFRDLRG